MRLPAFVAAGLAGLAMLVVIWRAFAAQRPLMSLLAWRAARRSAVLQTRALGARGDFEQSYGIFGGPARAQEPKERTWDQRAKPARKGKRANSVKETCRGTFPRHLTGRRRIST